MMMHGYKSPYFSESITPRLENPEPLFREEGDLWIKEIAEIKLIKDYITNPIRWDGRDGMEGMSKTSRDQLPMLFCVSIHMAFWKHENTYFV